MALSMDEIFLLVCTIPDPPRHNFLSIVQTLIVPSTFPATVKLTNDYPPLRTSAFDFFILFFIVAKK
jgi:hypothetical protein